MPDSEIEAVNAAVALGVSEVVALSVAVLANTARALTLSLAVPLSEVVQG